MDARDPDRATPDRDAPDRDASVKTAIYQYWRGKRPPYSFVSERLFRHYAAAIGADYHFSNGDIDFPCLYKEYFGALLPIYSKMFSRYDAVLYCDMDIIPREGIFQNIFDETEGDVMMVEETVQPDLREDMSGDINSRNDLRWASLVSKIWGRDVWRDDLGRPRVFNSGVCLYSKTGLEKIRTISPSVLAYQLMVKLFGLPRFYCLDQNYLNAALCDAAIDFKPLNANWNGQITRYLDLNNVARLVDLRTNETCFFHLQHGAQKNRMTEAEARSVARGDYIFSV